jgi:hypothetical protein
VGISEHGQCERHLSGRHPSSSVTILGHNKPPSVSVKLHNTSGLSKHVFGVCIVHEQGSVTTTPPARIPYTQNWTFRLPSGEQQHSPSILIRVHYIYAAVALPLEKPIEADERWVDAALCLLCAFSSHLILSLSILRPPHRLQACHKAARIES